MELQLKVTRITRRTETVQGRGEPDRQQGFEDVECEAVGGTPFLGSAAGHLRFTIDNPAALGQLSEGGIYTVRL